MEAERTELSPEGAGGRFNRDRGNSAVDGSGRRFQVGSHPRSRDFPRCIRRSLERLLNPCAGLPLHNRRMTTESLLEPTGTGVRRIGKTYLPARQSESGQLGELVGTIESRAVDNRSVGSSAEQSRNCGAARGHDRHCSSTGLAKLALE